jgi:hypothetical protein
MIATPMPALPAINMITPPAKVVAATKIVEKEVVD